MIFSFEKLLSSAAAESLNFSSCVPKQCEKGPKIRFPFFINGIQEPFCGLFNISCGILGYPIINISGNDYLIIKSFYKINSFWVYNIAVHNISNNRISEIRNVTPSSPLISIASESGFHLLSRCRGLPIQQFQKYRLQLYSSPYGIVLC